MKALRIGFLIVPLVVLCGQSWSAETPSPAGKVIPGDPNLPVTSGLKPILSFDGNPISYAIDGSGSPAIVLIHCWSCNRDYWHGQINDLASRYATISIDLPGHGQSGSARKEWTLQSYGLDVQTVVEALGLSKVILVGHSMGGPVALEAAKLLKGRVIGIIGVDTFHNAENRIDVNQWKSLIQQYEADFPGTCGRFVRSMFPESANQDLVQSTATGMCSANPKIALPLFKTFADYDMATAMKEAKVPIRCINSATYPTLIEVNRKYAPAFDVSVMEGVGHFLMLEKPEEFNRMLLDAIAKLAPVQP